MGYRDLWKDVLDIIGKEIASFYFEILFKPTRLEEAKDGKLFIITNSKSSKEKIINNYFQILSIAMLDVFKTDKFEVLTKDEYDNHISSLKDDNIDKLDINNLYSFNEKYTFDKFVVGSSNQHVYAACNSVAETPAAKFNPLFIYGGVGLGKTHLLHSIGNSLQKHKPELKVLYVTFEQFTNDYIDNLRNNQVSDGLLNFRKKYRNVDVLMVDDIQLIEGKKETQEQFFHTFNDLYQNKKQVIIASDRNPNKIPTLSDRLKSRFSMGLIQDIQKPDFETRIAILQKKAQQERYVVSNDVINFIAESISSNIREMEGSLQKAYFYANLLGKHEATIEDAKAALQFLVKEESQKITTDKIIDSVCKYYNADKDLVLGKSKKKEVVEPRQIAIYIITEIMDIPLTSIGQVFGKKDHTTIMYSRDKISNSLKTNQRLKIVIDDIKKIVLDN